MSISTTSGRCRSTAASTSRPSSASPTTSTASAPASIIRSPERTSASSSTSRTRITASTAASRAGRSRRAGSAVLERAAGELDALGEPDQAGTRPAAAGTGDRRAPADDLHDELLVRGRDGHLDRRGGRVLARVGQPFLHDPVGGAPDHRLAAAGLDPRAHASCPPRATPRSAPGSRPASAAAGATPSAARAARRSPRAGPAARRGRSARITAGRLGDLLRRRVRPELQRAGVHATAATAGARARRASRPRSGAARPRAPARRARAARPRAARARSCERAQQVALRAGEQAPGDHERA